MRKALVTALVALALAGCSAGDLVSPGQAPAVPPAPAAQAPASQPQSQNPAKSPAEQAPAAQPQGGQAPAVPAPSTPPKAGEGPIAVNPVQPAPPAGGGANPAPPSGGIRFNTWSITPVAAQDLKDPARAWLGTHHDDPAFAVFRDGKDTYLLAAIGQRNTGGYSVQITSVGDSNGQVEVVVQEQTPKPGTMVPMIVTWPVAAAKVSNLPDNLSVRFVLSSPSSGGSQTYQATVLR